MWYTDVRKGFGLAIKVWRDKCGISQEELAWRAGLHRTYVADIERGARNPSLRSVEKIAQALKISFSTLFEPMQNSPEGAEEPLKPHDLVEVLLVDDNPADAEATVRVFREAHVLNQVHVAPNAAAAVEFLWSPVRCENLVLKQRARLVLLGSDRNGMEVLRRLKADPSTRNIPVIVLTTARDDRQLQECRRLGAEMHLVKPMQFEKLRALLLQLSLSWGLLARCAPAAAAALETGS